MYEERPGSQPMCNRHHFTFEIWQEKIDRLISLTEATNVQVNNALIRFEKVEARISKCEDESSYTTKIVHGAIKIVLTLITTAVVYTVLSKD